MIKILIEGDRERAHKKRMRPVRFNCPVCGCSWEADWFDYTATWDFKEGYHIFSATCPCCYETVKSNENR